MHSAAWFCFSDGQKSILSYSVKVDTALNKCYELSLI